MLYICYEWLSKVFSFNVNFNKEWSNILKKLNWLLFYHISCIVIHPNERLLRQKILSEFSSKPLSSKYPLKYSMHCSNNKGLSVGKLLRLFAWLFQRRRKAVWRMDLEDKKYCSQLAKMLQLVHSKLWWAH